MGRPSLPKAAPDVDAGLVALPAFVVAEDVADELVVAAVVPVPAA
jgi:hypothetical protein